MVDALRSTLFATGLLLAGQGIAAERIVGLPCEGCEAVFEVVAPREAAPMRIAPADESGERLRIEGVVRDPAGRPAAGIVVYAYHTDAQGLYPRDPAAPGPATARHGRLRGVARTDTAGGFSFDTIRPAGYPGTDLPQHVHFHVLEPGRCTYWIDDLVFSDDPRLTDAMRRLVSSGRGGAGLSTPLRDADGGWRVRRDIVLGAGIGDYARCGD